MHKFHFQIEAVGFYRKAINLVEMKYVNVAESRHGKWYRCMGECYFRLGDLTSAKQVLKRSLAVLNHVKQNFL